MSYSIVTKDGITINDIPDDMAPDSPELKARVAAIRAGKPQESAPTTTAEGLAGAGIRGLGPVAAGAAVGAALGAPIMGVGAVPGAAGGAAAAGLTQMLGDPITQAVNSTFGTNWQMPSEALNDFFTRMGVPEPKTAAERVMQVASAGAGGAGAMAALGKTIQGVGAGMPVLQASGAQLAAQPLQQIAGGAGAGAAGQMSAEAGGSPAEQLLASILGGVTGAGVAGMGVKPQLPTPSALNPNQPAAAVANAEAQGIVPMTSDVVPPKTFAAKWLQTVGERIPVAGTGSVREAQQGQRVNAIRTLLKDFGADDAAAASDKVMADLAAKRGADLSKYSALKGDVIERLDSAGVMPVSKATQEIDSQIASLQSLKSQDVEPVISMLGNFKQAIQGQGIANVERLRRQLGESLASNPSLLAARSEGEKAARNIYRALNEDMGAHIKSAGEPRDFTKWAVANKRLSEMAGEVKTGALRTVLAKGEATPEVVNKMLFSQKPSEIQQLYRGLSQAGKANARTAILQKAIHDAGGIENINPDRFATQVGKLSRSIGVFFSGDELRQVDGLARALNLTRRAQQTSANPTTGAQLAIPVGASVLTDLLGGWGAATATGATVGLAARAYESAPVRNLLVKIAQTPKGSTEEAALVKRAIAAMQASQQTQEPSNGR